MIAVVVKIQPVACYDGMAVSDCGDTEFYSKLYLMWIRHVVWPIPNLSGKVIIGTEINLA